MRKFTYAQAGIQYDLPTVDIIEGIPPFDSPKIYPVNDKFKTLPAGYMKVVDGVIEEKTQEEKIAFNEARASYEQTSKSDELKTTENNFLSMCDLLTQSTTHEKLGFDEIHEILNDWPDPMQKVDLSISLLAIDAQAKREGGLEWWDTCAWHEDIV